MASDVSHPAAQRADFAATVQSLPAVEAPGGPVSGLPSDLPVNAGDSLPAPDSDIGLEIATEPANVAEQPTLSHIGRYALKSLIGEGGLGRVYEAWDPLLSRPVAVKTLQFDLDMPSRLALDRMLLNEARAAAGLNHSHIVTVHDAGLSAHGVYIAMERLRGRDLRQAIAEGWLPSPELAAQVVRRVADALAYAHAKGVVHCDIKPGNIFLTRKDKPKVLDFGIARAAHASTRPAGDGTIAGSPHYMAPEQLDGGTVDARTDIYSLAVVLHELLTGRKAFEGDSLEALHAAVRAGGAPEVITLRPSVPAALSSLVARAMSVDPAARPSSASEFSQALRRAVAPPQASAAGLGAATSATSRRNGRRWLSAALLGGAAAASLAWTMRPDPETTQTVAVAPAPARAAPAPTAAAPVTVATSATVTAAVGSAQTDASAVTPATDAAAPSIRSSPAPMATPVAAAASRASPRAPVASRVAAARARVAADQQADVAPPAPVVTGTVQIAVSPWGQVEVDGNPAGTTPPLTSLTLPEGTHTITLRNADFTPYTATVQVQGDRPVVVRHRFGS